MVLPRAVPLIAIATAVALVLVWSRTGAGAGGIAPSVASQDVTEVTAASPPSSTAVGALTNVSSTDERVSPRLDPGEVIDVDDEFPDPTVLSTTNGYVAYGTNITVSGELLNVPARTSAGLTSWSVVIDVLPDLPAWAEPGQTWAPSVVARDGHYELYFAALDRSSGLECIGVATSDEPLGPFVSEDEEPLVCVPTLGGAIDPEVAVVSGTTYLLWKNDGNCCDIAVRLWAQELHGTALVGTAVNVLEADASWEHGVIENPTVVVEDDTIVLLYSGGYWNSDGYGTGYAVCEDLRSRCTKQSRSGPILDDVDGTTGNGGASAFRTEDGRTWLVGHAWPESGSDRGYRSMWLAPLTIAVA